MAAGQYTPSGARRAGDDYQDVVGLDLAVEWLEHPERFAAMKFEADDAGALDDVTAWFSGGRGRILKQVKFSTDPDRDGDTWDWARLLNQRVGDTGRTLPSLIQRWADSLRQVTTAGGDTATDASLVSNRRAAAELRGLLRTDQRLDYGRITDDALRQRIEEQLGGEAAARAFFSLFRFDVDRPDLATYEDAVRRRFLALGGTNYGWLSLKDAVRGWTGRKNEPGPDGVVRFEDVRREAQWNPLQSLPQGFAIPTDYVTPDRSWHKQLIRRLLETGRTGGGCLVLTAPPGRGKSTYASVLYRLFNRAGVPSVRHHYFLAQRDDRTQSLRLGHQRAALSLMHDLAHDHARALGERSVRNPDPNELRDWMEACGTFYAARGHPLIVIVDGLDHVWRERRSVEEAESLLQHLLPTPEGVVVLLVTQPLDTDRLPPVMRRNAPPREKWLELPLMDIHAVRRWLGRHAADVTLPDETAPAPAHHRDRVADEMFAKSGGHPLALRYTLAALQERGMPVTPDNVRRLPGCPHEDIGRYYEALIADVPEAGRDVLYLLTACGFSWRREDIAACLASPTVPEPTVRDGLRHVAHLLAADEMGLRPFHASLPVYMASLPDFGARAPAVRRRALDWLRSDAAPDQWRWANEWLLRYELGDAAPLLAGPTRGWAVEALARRRTYDEADRILNRATYAAFQSPETLPRAVQLGVLHDYMVRVYDEHRDVFERLLPTQIALGEDPYLRARLRSDLDGLTEAELGTLGEDEAARGDERAAVCCFAVLNRRLKRGGDGRRRRSFEYDWRDDVRPLLHVLGAYQRPDLRGVVAYAVRNPDSTHEITTMLARYLRAGSRAASLRGLLSACAECDAPVAHRAALEQAVLLAQEEELDLDSDAPGATEGAPDTFGLIYGALRGLPPSGQAAPFPDHASYNPDDIHLRHRPEGGPRFVRDLFFAMLANHLLGAAEQNVRWRQVVLPQAGWDPWAEDLAGALDLVASAIAERLAAGERVDIADFYAPLAALPRPRWPDADTSHAAQHLGDATAAALLEIGLDLLALGAPAAPPAITRTELEEAFKSRFCDAHEWMKAYAAGRRRWLEEDAVRWLLDSQEADLAGSLGILYERADRFATLAAVASLHGLPEDAARLVRLCAENLLAHGHHKDGLLFACIGAAQRCAAVTGGTDVAPRAWLKRLAPAVAAVTDYTDGDEALHLPRQMADALAVAAPDLLLAYFVWLSGHEQNWYADNALHAFLRTTDLSDPVNRAIAGTAVDAESLEIIAARARGDEGATLVMSSLGAMLGMGAFLKQEGDGSRAEPIYGDLEEEEEALTPADFPPERLEELLRRLAQGHAFPALTKSDAKAWLGYWRSHGRGEAAFVALREAAERRGRYLRCADVLYEAALALYGKREAFPWLVKAFAEQHCWSDHITGEERAVALWGRVRAKHAADWFVFLRETFVGEHVETYTGVFIDASQVERLVAYCLALGQPDVARGISATLIESALELVSPLRLPRAAWAEGEPAESAG